MMNGFDYNEYADDLIRAIEAEYGGTVERVVKMMDFGSYFELTMIFQDYKMLEVEVRVEEDSVTLQGRYY